LRRPRSGYGVREGWVRGGLGGSWSGPWPPRGSSRSVGLTDPVVLGLRLLGREYLGRPCFWWREHRVKSAGAISLAGRFSRRRCVAVAQPPPLLPIYSDGFCCCCCCCCCYRVLSAGCFCSRPLPPGSHDQRLVSSINTSTVSKSG